MGVIGSVILVKDYIEKIKVRINFRGFDVVDIDFLILFFECKGCLNRCEVVKVLMEGKVIVMWGDRCGKWINLF